MNCPTCGKEIENDVAFCKYCGTPVDFASSADSIEKTEIVEDSFQECSDSPSEELLEEKSEAKEESHHEANNQKSDNDTEVESVIIGQETTKRPVKKLSKIIALSVAVLSIAAILIVTFILIANNRIVELKTDYQGEIADGIVIDGSNTGIKVIGIKKNGKEIELNDWAVEEPITLKEDTISTVHITYKKLHRDLPVICPAKNYKDYQTNGLVYAVPEKWTYKNDNEDSNQYFYDHDSNMLMIRWDETKITDLTDEYIESLKSGIYSSVTEHEELLSHHFQQGNLLIYNIVFTGNINRTPCYSNSYIFVHNHILYMFGFTSTGNEGKQCNSFDTNIQRILSSIIFTEPIKKIYASYSGELSEGTIINSKKDIKVYEQYQDGSATEITQYVSFSQNKIRLDKDETEIVDIYYIGFFCNLTLKCSDRTIVGFSATYFGATDAGITLDKANKGIHVGFDYKDGEREYVYDWTIEQPATLEWEKEAVVKISYKDYSCDLKVFCTSGLKGITASYTGSVEAGTKIDSTNNNIKVTGLRVDGKEEILKNWELAAPVTLEWGKEAVLNISYKDQTCSLKIVCKSDIKELTAKYNGETTAGTTINNSNIVVTAIKENGSTETVTDWTTDSATVTLEVDKAVDIKIKYKDKECNLRIVCSTISEAAYKRNCESISYTELARNPKQYEGRQVKFKGEVVQVLEDTLLGTTYVSLRVNTKWGYSMYTDDTVYVTYQMGADSPRFLEDDIVTFYGEYKGLYSYESIMGATITIPKVAAKYIDLN